jgi:RNA 3'-terminal phosphate cyclase
LLDEIFTGGVIDGNNQPTLLLMAALASGDNISSVKLTRITQQSMAMLKNLKTFFNL